MPNVILNGNNVLNTVSLGDSYSSRYLYKGEDGLQYAEGFCIGTLKRMSTNVKQLSINNSQTSVGGDQFSDIPLYGVGSAGSSGTYCLNGYVGLNDIGVTTPAVIGDDANFKNNTAISYTTSGAGTGSDSAFMGNMHGRLEAAISNLDHFSANKIQVINNGTTIVIVLYHDNTELTRASANIDDLLPPYIYVVANTPGSYANKRYRYSFTNYVHADVTATPYILGQCESETNTSVQFFKSVNCPSTTATITNGLNSLTLVSNKGGYANGMTKSNGHIVGEDFSDAQKTQNNMSVTVRSTGAVLGKNIQTGFASVPTLTYDNTMIAANNYCNVSIQVSNNKYYLNLGYTGQCLLGIFGIGTSTVLYSSILRGGNNYYPRGFYNPSKTINGYNPIPTTMSLIEKEYPLSTRTSIVYFLAGEDPDPMTFDTAVDGGNFTTAEFNTSKLSFYAWFYNNGWSYNYYSNFDSFVAIQTFPFYRQNLIYYDQNNISHYYTGGLTADDSRYNIGSNNNKLPGIECDNSSTLKMHGGAILNGSGETFYLNKTSGSTAGTPTLTTEPMFEIVGHKKIK